MSASTSRIGFHLPVTLKRTIEQAATLAGQSVSEFAVSTLVRTARQVIEEHDRTELSKRDRDIIIAMLDDKDARPNKFLAAAARRYKRRIR